MEYFLLDGQPVHVTRKDVDSYPPLPRYRTLADQLGVLVRNVGATELEYKAIAIAVIRASMQQPFFYCDRHFSIVAYFSRVELYMHPMDIHDYMREYTRHAKLLTEPVEAANDASP